MIRGESLAAAEDPVALLAWLRGLCRCGMLALLPVGSDLATREHGAGMQALRLGWEVGGDAHLLLLEPDRPEDGLDGSLDRHSDERALLELSEARIRALSADLHRTYEQALRESAQRTRVEHELERFRGWPLARRIFRSAVFSARHRWAIERRPEPRVAASAGEQPIFFVVGRGKSGTSWLMRALDEHPEVLCKGEGRFFGEEFLLLNPEARTLLATLERSPELWEWSYRSAWTRGAAFEEAMQDIAGAAAERLLRSRAAAEGKRIAGDKTPLFGRGDVVRQIGAACPTARVIHIVRDGRDVAVSALHHAWNSAERRGRELDAEAEDKRRRYRAGELDPATGDESVFPAGFLEYAARSWAEITGRASRQGSGLLGDRYLEVRYERMLDTPEDELARALAFLGASTDRETVAECVERTSFERLSKRAGGLGRGRSRGSEDPTSFFRKGVAGDWKTVFTPSDRETYKRIAGDVLIELGYELDASWQSASGAGTIGRH